MREMVARTEAREAAAKTRLAELTAARLQLLQASASDPAGDGAAGPRHHNC